MRASFLSRGVLVVPMPRLGSPRRYSQENFDSLYNLGAPPAIDHSLADRLEELNIVYCIPTVITVSQERHVSVVILGLLAFAVGL